MFLFCEMIKAVLGLTKCTQGAQMQKEHSNEAPYFPQDLDFTEHGLYTLRSASQSLEFSIFNLA